MTKKTLKLMYLITASVLTVVAMVIMITASVRTSKIGKHEHSHNLEVKSITVNEERSDRETRLICHDIVIDGKLRNDGDSDYLVAYVEIVFAGVKNTTGEYREFVYRSEIKDFNSGTGVSLPEETISVISRDGYIPEYIKEVKVVLNGRTEVVPFEDASELNLILFVLSLALIFIAGFLFVKWESLRRPQNLMSASQNKNDISNDAIIDGTALNDEGE